MTDLEIINKIEEIRSKNNINWMNVLRLAFKYAPDEAREIVSKINVDDNRIGELLKKLSDDLKIYDLLEEFQFFNDEKFELTKLISLVGSFSTGRCQAAILS